MRHFKTYIKETDEAGFICFTKDELKELLDEQYNRGYNDGVYQNPPVDVAEIDRPPVIQIVEEI